MKLVAAAILSVGTVALHLKPQESITPTFGVSFAVPDLDFFIGDDMQGTPPIFADITFKSIGGKPLTLDIHMPDDGFVRFGAQKKKNIPAMIYFHAGAWLIGSKASVHKNARKLLSEGIAIVSVDYRLISQEKQWGGESVAWPVQGYDVVDALKWVRAHGESYGIDPWNLGCWGDSAGGQLCAWLASAGAVEKATKLQVAVTMFGPNCFLCWEFRPHVVGPPPKDWYSSTDWYFGFEKNTLHHLMDHRDNLTLVETKDVELVQSSEPVHNVMSISRNNTPPMFIAHGTKDPTVPFEKSELLAKALATFGVTHKLVMAVDGKHGYQNWPEEPIEQAIKFAKYYLLR